MQNTIKCAEPASNPLVRIAVRSAIRTAMFSGAVAVTFGSTTVQAQQAPAASGTAEPELMEVVVTGSRIRQPALEAVSPVTSISDVQIKEAVIYYKGLK